MARTKTLFGIYGTADDAESAITALVGAGFERYYVSVLLSEGPQGGAVGVGMLAIPGLRRALAEMGVPEYEAKRYEERVKDGGNLISIRCETSDQVERAQAILRTSGADDIARRRPDIVIGSLPLKRIRATNLWL